MAKRGPVVRPPPVTSTRTRAAARPTGLWLRIGLLLVAGALVYANSLRGPFILDDQLAIVSNPHIRQFLPLSSVLVPKRELPVAGRPLVNLSLAINYAMGGLDVRGYHAWNVAVHLLCALVLFGAVRRTLSSAKVGVDPARSANLAFVSALLWMLHPLLTEAVDYVTQRTETMMGLFYLLTLYASIRAGGERERRMWQVVAVTSCAFGMACKESMATAPVIVLMYDRVFVFDSLRQAFRARGRLYGALAATWLLLAALIETGPRMNSAGFSAGVSPWTYLLNQTVMIVQYLRLAVWPRSLVVDYGVPLPLTLGEVWPYAFVVALLLLLTVAAIVWRPKLGFLGAWFFITLAPSSSVVPIATWVGAERRMYVSLAALVVLAVVAGSQIWKRVARAAAQAGSRATRIASIGGVMVLMAVATALALGTVARNREYASSLGLARTVLERRPHGRAHHWLATELLGAGRCEEGLAELREAIGDDPRASFTLGQELFNEGRMDEAIGQLEEFIRRQPELAEVVPARMMIGEALLAGRRLPEAAEQFTRVLTMVPSYTAAHRGLGDVRFAQQQFDEACAQYREFLTEHQNDVAVLIKLGIALSVAGRTDEAVVAFRRAVGVDPRNSAAHSNLANALLRGGAFDEAAFHARQALVLTPGEPVTHDILGLALVARGQVDEAIAEFRQSLQLDPENSEARDHLTSALQSKASSGQPR